MSGASSCAVRSCHSGAEQAVKPLDSRDRGHDKENMDIRVVFLKIENISMCIQLKNLQSLGL